MARVATILALALSLLWPWGALASACATSGERAGGCCATRCCCEGDGQDSAAPCGCEAGDAPARPTERAPATPPSGGVELDRALDVAPLPTLDLAPVAGARVAPRATPRSDRTQSGRGVLLRSCCLRH